MRRIRLEPVIVVGLVASLVTLVGAGWDPAKEKLKKEEAKADRAIAAFKGDNPRLETYFKQARAFAVFPSIGTGGVVVSGAYGTGLVYEGDKVIGRATSTKAGVGLTLGGGTYSELVFFRDQDALDRFTQGKLTLEAGAKVVLLHGGPATETSWSDGVAVFIRGKEGLMGDASVGGQVFGYEPLPEHLARLGS
jgi:lipid-binding SYLF domain-containing protein